MAAPAIFAIQGLAQLGLGAANLYQANQMRKQAQPEFDQSMNEFKNQDFSNVYANMENPFEDLTVNTRQFQLQSDVLAQGLADTMAGLRRSAGGSGAAAFAQSLANQQARNFAALGAQVGQQEARNQGLIAQGRMTQQRLEATGEAQARALRNQNISTRLGMSMNMLAGANRARQQAFGQIAGGVGNIAAGAYGMYQNNQGNETDLGGGVSVGNNSPVTMEQISFGANPSRQQGVTEPDALVQDLLNQGFTSQQIDLLRTLGKLD